MALPVYNVHYFMYCPIAILTHTNTSIVFQVSNFEGPSCLVSIGLKAAQ
jgi:hypothetical protein